MNENNRHMQHTQIIENAYCPTPNLTAEVCLQANAVHYNKLVFEVPFDQYEEVLMLVQSAMEEPKKQIKKGAFTYAQVAHISEACNIHNLRKDENGRINFRDEQIAMSTAISFAQSKWNGATREVATENAVYTGLAVLGESFAEEVIEQHMIHTEVMVQPELSTDFSNKVKQGGTKAVVKKMATAATRKAMSGSSVAKKAMLLLNANVVTGALITGVMSTVDLVCMIKGQLSPTQLFKNVAKTAAGVAGGIAGLIIGGGIGLTIPDVSTIIVSFIGGLIGLLVGSAFASKVATKIMGLFVKDDAVQMLEVFNKVLVDCCQQYLLNEEELEQVLEDFNTVYDMPSQLRAMYAAVDQEAYARNLIERELFRIVHNRMYLHVPSNEEIYVTLQTI